jgi:hypothetical protein
MLLSADFRNLQRLSWATLLLAVLCIALNPTPARATNSPDEHLLDQKGIDELKARALHADAKDQLYIFAQIVHQLTELSAQKYAEGDADSAVAELKQIQDFTHKIALSIADHHKQLKNAEILLRHTAFRLREMMHSSSVDDSTAVRETLAQIDNLEADTLQQVFKK